MNDIHSLPESWPEPPTDPPDDDRDAPEEEREHDCDEVAIAESFTCIPCIPCYRLTGETVCQFTCSHRKDIDE